MVHTVLFSFKDVGCILFLKLNCGYVAKLVIFPQMYMFVNTYLYFICDSYISFF